MRSASSVLVLALCCSMCAAVSSSTARALTQTGPTAFECGKAGNPCGTSIPAGVTCMKGLGWCESGHYCGYNKGEQGTVSKCIPVPKACGNEGNPCCPSNAESPHYTMEDKSKKAPFCKDGSVCFYNSQQLSMKLEKEFYTANTGDLCVTIAKDCGTGPGSPCCPTLYRQRTNPELPRGGCPGSNEYCNPDRTAMKQNEGKPYTFTPGTCLRNAPDCGKFGKSCCHFMASSSSVETCGLHLEGGRKGYCANPPGYTEVDGYRYAPENERVCTVCPAKVDAAAEAKQPALSGCK